MNRTPTWIKAMYWAMLPCAVANIMLALALAYVGAFWLTLSVTVWAAYCHWVWTRRPRD